jgi:DNA-binding IclR family transcriptional regulator
MNAPSAIRVLDLIEWLATQSVPVALADACQALALPKSSTLLLLKTLVDRRYAIRGDDGRYQLLRLPGEASAETRAWGTMLRIASPFLRDAVEEVQESGFIAVLTDKQQVRYLNKMLPDREIRYDRDIRADRVAHHVASGIAILSALPEDEVEQYLMVLDASTPGPDHPDQVRAAISKARGDGIAINLKGRIENASGLAAPILDANKRPIAAFNLSGPADRVMKNLDALVLATRKGADRVSQELMRRMCETSNPRRK